jgi:hypothetical protein
MKTFDAPMLVLLSPHGTFNGAAAADQLTVEFQVLGATLGKNAHNVLLQVLAGGETHESTLFENHPVRVVGLPSGDHRVSITLLDASGRPVISPYASQSVTVTVNRDAPVE